MIAETGSINSPENNWSKERRSPKQTEINCRSEIRTLIG